MFYYDEILREVCSWFWKWLLIPLWYGDVYCVLKCVIFNFVQHSGKQDLFNEQVSSTNLHVNMNKLSFTHIQILKAFRKSNIY